MNGKLRVLFYIIAIYLAVFGLLFLFAPSLAERFTKTTHDPSLGLLYGQYALTFAFASFLGARGKEGAGKLSLVILLLVAGQAVVFGYLLLTGIQAFAQAGPPIIVNAILAILVFWFRKERKRIP